MALIPETGTGLNANANSYGDLVGLKLYAAERGIDISLLSDIELDVFMIKAMDYLEHTQNYAGNKSTGIQPLQWPRTQVWIDGVLHASNAIPAQLIKAQYALALNAKDTELQPNRLPSDKGRVLKERVEGAVEVVYSDTGSKPHTPSFTTVEALLQALSKSSGVVLVRA